MKVGPTKGGLYGSVLWTHYPSSGETAMAIMDDISSEMIMVATVNLYEPAPPPCADDEVWLKTWSENEGIDKLLETCGVCFLTGEVWTAGYAIAKKARLTSAAIAERNSSMTPEERELKKLAKDRTIKAYNEALTKVE